VHLLVKKDGTNMKIIHRYVREELIKLAELGCVHLVSCSMYYSMYLAADTCTSNTVLPYLPTERE